MKAFRLIAQLHHLQSGFNTKHGCIIQWRYHRFTSQRFIIIQDYSSLSDLTQVLTAIIPGLFKLEEITHLIKYYGITLDAYLSQEEIRSRPDKVGPLNITNITYMSSHPLLDTYYRYDSGPIINTDKVLALFYISH